MVNNNLDELHAGLIPIQTPCINMPNIKTINSGVNHAFSSWNQPM